MIKYLCEVFIMERLQKVIAASGYTSRRKAEELIKDGKVQVNGVVVTELGTKVDGNDDIMINNVHLSREEHVYYLLNKPRGVISSVSDEHNRKTVVDLINTDKRIFPIGRLDYDTTGLIILTNDGNLSNLLSHPSHKVPKTYVAKLSHVFKPADFMKLKQGVLVDGKKCIPTRVKIKKSNIEKDYSIVEITIVEGRNHIVKNVFKELGYLVDKLSRIEYDFLTIDGLKSGEYRPLTIKEVKKLYEKKSRD